MTENYKKEKAIIFIVNKDYLFALSTMIINLQEVSPNSYDEIVVYSDGLSEEERKKLYNIEKNIKFIEYSLIDWIKEHKEVTSPQSQFFLKKYSHLAWSKYKVFEQLEFYHKILFLDLDMLIKQDITDIFNIPANFSWRSGQNFHGKFGNKKNLIEKISDIPKNYPSPNGGLLYASDEINFRDFCQNARHFTIQFLDFFASGLDELSIAWATFQNKIAVHELREHEYNTLPAKYTQDTKILHFMGEEKLWNNELLQSIFPEWIKFYKKSLLLTGFENEKVKVYENLGFTIRKNLNENRWFNLLKNEKLEIPTYLRFDFNFGNEWLILRYKTNSNIYYEFKFSQFQSGYSIGLWVKDKFYQSDEKIMSSINDVVKQSNYLNKIIDNRGVYIYTSKVEASEIPDLFRYFLKVTEPLIS